MRKFLMAVVCVVVVGGFAEAREPLFPRVRAFFGGGQCGQGQVVREYVQSQPVRVAVANGLESTGNVIQQAAYVVRPATCANGQCGR